MMLPLSVVALFSDPLSYRYSFYKDKRHASDSHATLAKNPLAHKGMGMVCTWPFLAGDHQQSAGMLLITGLERVSMLLTSGQRVVLACCVSLALDFAGMLLIQRRMVMWMQQGLCSP